MRLLLVGNPGQMHVGAHLRHAASDLGIDSILMDVTPAFEASSWRRRIDWWLRGHRPARLGAFSRQVVETARAHRATHLLTTGLAPVDAEALRALSTRDVVRLNFLTDDPWNPAHRAPWFMRALPHYDRVFTPRRANAGQLADLGIPHVEYLPFAYAPDVHFAEPPASDEERRRYAADLVFAGGADRDRVASVTPFIRAGLDVALYGGYWHRYVSTRPHARGFLDAEGLRKAVSGARVSLCLVRRANRDGHVMRTFETAAMGGCLLVEDTAEHREILGPDGDAAVYFRTPAEGVAHARRLIGDAGLRNRLASAAAGRMRTGTHTYSARLETMLQSCGASPASLLRTAGRT